MVRSARQPVSHHRLADSRQALAKRVISGTLLGLPDPIVTAREAGIYRSYKIHGIPKLSILLSPVLTTILHTLIVSLLIAITAPFLFEEYWMVGPYK